MATNTVLVRCPDCDQANIIRYGYTESGFQRYRCKDCARIFCDAPERGHTPQFKEQVLAAYLERASMRGIARTFHISRNTLTTWLKEKGGTCPT